MRSDTRLISRITTFVVIGLLSACGASEMTDLKQFVSDKAERLAVNRANPTFTVRRLRILPPGCDHRSIVLSRWLVDDT